MPRGKAKPKHEPSKLLQAMQFLSVCQKSESTDDRHMYCSLQHGTAVAFDGILAAGIRIDEDLDACPHTHQMVLALSRCGDKFAITQLSPESLSVRSGEFEAYIPCCKRERLTPVSPEAGTIPVSPNLTSALELVAPLASDKADVLEAASIQLNVNSVLATNREMIMEAWHGSNLPFGELLIPKMAATALSKIRKKIVGIGLHAAREALTFWFEDDSWLRTNLYKGKWRNEIIVPMQKQPSSTTRPIPQSFFDTVGKVLPFSDDGKVYCAEGKVASHYKVRTGAGYSLPVEDGPSNKIYKGKNLLIAGKVSTSIDEDQSDKFTMFFGPITRCAVWHDKLFIESEVTDEDIPF